MTTFSYYPPKPGTKIDLGLFQAGDYFRYHAWRVVGKPNIIFYSPADGEIAAWGESHEDTYSSPEEQFHANFFPIY
jgi:hypothetical protein